MNRPRLYRGLRITASAVSGVVCVMLVAMWVRSEGSWGKPYNEQQGSVALIDGQEFIIFPCFLPPYHRDPHFWDVIDPYFWDVPYWFPVAVFATLAAVPWLPWSNRFSLRTLLIAVTLAAVGLGVLVYLVRG